MTGKGEDRGAFKTPTLREIARTAPYMHDGSLVTLHEVIDYYNRGGNPSPGLDPELRPLRLTTGERRALAAFLRSLSGTVSEGRRSLTRTSQSDRSGLVGLSWSPVPSLNLVMNRHTRPLALPSEIR